MMIMDLDLWTERAKKSIEKFSDRQKIALLYALDLYFLSKGIEVVHSDTAVEFYDELAEKLGVRFIYKDEELDAV